MYFIPPEMDPNFFVQKGFKFFTMPWGPWAKAGIQNGLSGIKRQRRSTRTVRRTARSPSVRRCGEIGIAARRAR
jgi:hypothetical protein